MAETVETLEVDLRTRVRSPGAKAKARWKKWRVKFSVIKNKVFQMNCMKLGVERLCSGDGSHRKIKVEEADGSNSGQNECDLLVLVRESFGL